MRGTSGHIARSSYCGAPVRPLSYPLTRNEEKSGQSAVTVSAPAKINWVLDLLERRPDGYHELETVGSTIGLCDELAVSLPEPAERAGITLTCDDPSLPTDGTNLVHQAASLLARRAGVRHGVAIHLTKRIPMGAGLGGGSSDAAAALRGLNRLWGLNWSPARLTPIAAAVGSDVPLLLIGGAAVARGRGEFVEPLAFEWPGWVVVAMPGIHAATRDVYAAVRQDDLRAVSDAASAFADGDAARRWTAIELLDRCRNGLEPAAFRRFAELDALHQRLEGRFGRSWRLCGSGSSFFTAWDTAEEAASCAKVVRTEFAIRAEATQPEKSEW